MNTPSPKPRFNSKKPPNDSQPINPNDPHLNPAPFYGDSPFSQTRKSLLFIVLAAVLAVGGGLYFNQQTSNVNTPSTDSSVPDSITPGEIPDWAVNFDYQDYSTQASTTIGFNTFTQNALGIKIDYPSDWQVAAVSQLIPAMFSSPVKENSPGDFTENVVFSLEDISAYEGVTLEQYGDAAYGQLLKALPDYKLLERGVRKVGSYDGAYLLGSYSVDETLQGNVMSIFTLVEGTVYIISYTYTSTTDNSFQDIFEAMVNSFYLLPLSNIGNS
ncbi:MAG: hypothetical protein UT55_C0047G0005 [Candidatus Peregrinibacteria bacterium GW2011_GWE2_39_6]|nr:MAG: hypothetical protein UT36_C0001G0090 [Candidatus Peregrinibacteria bacterium GW2011_GWF2_39_17]KKR25263.1 MAG: hypothetical protein UT55_C0047G0005 [Candidatus Peregrinibacteria bacterium GW2011_GWE2_39_6]HCW32432.1 hypothetical protein [Candidatus Peregrinibacteria bacterium]